MNTETKNYLNSIGFPEDHLPGVPDYFPETARAEAQKYLNRQIEASVRFFRQKYAHPDGCLYFSRKEKLPELHAAKYEIGSFHWKFGWLLPNQISPNLPHPNHFAIVEKQDVTARRMVQCLGGIIQNEDLGMALGFHIYPVDSSSGPPKRSYDPLDRCDLTMVEKADGYFQALCKMAPFEPTRMDVASSYGGWTPNRAEQKWERKNDEAHRVMIDSLRRAFGALIPVSMWNTSQIRLEATSRKIVDPEFGIELPKNGSIDYWTVINETL